MTSIDKNPSVEVISAHVLDIARQAKSMGVKNIYVCGLIIRKNNRLDNITKDINLALQLVSSDEGYIYIANDDIFKSDLNGDGLHLNPKGTNKLIQNILQHTCTTY